jgi:hypothetical protein
MPIGQRILLRMPSFRAYVVGPSGEYIRVHEIAEFDEKQAIAAAIKLVRDSDLAVWCGDEFIGTLSPSEDSTNGPTFKRPCK